MIRPIVLLLIGIASGLIAQDKPAVPELDTLDHQYEDKLADDVQGPHDSAVTALNKRYAEALLNAQKQAEKATELQEALAIKAEHERTANAIGPLEKSPAAQNFESLKTLWETYHTSLAKIDLDRDKALFTLNTAFAKHLDAVVASLTQTGKLDAAKAVADRRKALVLTDPAPAPAEAPHPKPGESVLGAKHLRFRATVPATDVIKISDGKLWIEDHAIKLYPYKIRINDTAWTPVWGKKDRKSDKFNLAGILASFDSAAKVTVVKTSGRGELTVQSLPSADNGQTLAFQIYDPQPDAGDYDILISW